VKYELSFYIPEADILHSHCRVNVKSYTVLVVATAEETSKPRTEKASEAKEI
jgi:hypothetical protein